MFGLMKYYRCSGNQEDREQYRRHYCGVCKTLGKLYGHHTRFLLNRDLVFLSELIAELSEEKTTTTTWECHALHVRRCFQLPRHSEDIPLSLRITATYNILMTRYKLDDNIADANNLTSYLWKVVRFAFSGAFARASRQVAVWDYPFKQVEWWMHEQRNRELHPPEPEDPEQAMQFFAEPSAVTTGLSMKYAAMITGQADEAERMYQLGYNFGQLIYVLDALEDFEEDDEQGAFNAIRAVYQIADRSLPPGCRHDIVNITRNLEEKIRHTLGELYLSEVKAHHFNTRLTWNVNRKLGREVS